MQAQIVIRASGERSLPLCLRSVKSQTDDFVLIEETPFIKAVTKTFEIGKNSSKDLLIAVDADIILNTKAIETMIEETKETLRKVPNLFTLDFPLIDKFRGTCLGCHVYQNKYSEQFYEHFKNIAYDPKEPRPEKSNIILLKEKLGLVNTSHHIPVGLHDYEQYYSHIYSKYYRRAVRQAAFIPEIIDRILQRRLEHPGDLDFVVALYGLYSGEGKGEVITDARLYPRIEDVMGIQEKPPIQL